MIGSTPSPEGPQAATAAKGGWSVFRYRNLVFGGIIIGLILLVTMGAGLFTRYNPTATNALATVQPPSWHHLFGTDQLGRDLLSRVLYGGRVTILASAGSVLIGVVCGSLIGVVAGVVGGQVDMLLMRLMDLILAFPGILPALAITAILGPNLINLMIAIGLSSIPGYARVVEGVTLQVKELVYVEAARSAGSTTAYLVRRHVLPNVFSVIIVAATTGLGVAVLWVAALGFIGLGVQPPTPEWGTILNDGRQYITLAWWISLFPGIFISLYIIAVNIMGDGLRDLLDPTHAP